MAGNISVERVLSDSALLVNAWKSNPGFALGDIRRDVIKADVAQIRQDTEEIEALRSQLTLKIDQRDQKLKALSNKNTRVRSGFRAFYGPDSSEYKQAGGTPTSERKARTRTPKIPPIP